MHGMRTNRTFGNWIERNSLIGVGLASVVRANTSQISRRVVGI